MARTLAANVYVGETLYRAGTSPEKEIADQITNPKAWEDGKGSDPAPAPAPAAPAADGAGDTAPEDKAPAAPAPAKKAAAPRKTAAKKAAASPKSE